LFDNEEHGWGRCILHEADGSLKTGRKHFEPDLRSSRVRRDKKDEDRGDSTRGASHRAERRHYAMIPRPSMAAIPRARFAFVLAWAAALLLTTCGGSSNPPSPGTPGGGGGETITGRERIGWTQQALDSEQLATFRYAAYVDGVRRVLEGAACAGSSGGAFDCSAPLPPISPGQHTIELVSFTMSDDTILESERSSPLRVTVSAVSPSSLIDGNATLSTSDGHHFSASVVAKGLDDPTDVAIAPDGRVFVIERAGRVRIFDGREGDPPALELGDVSLSPDSGLTSIALDPKFESNGFVYLAYTTETRDTLALKIARFRERSGVLAQGALVIRERTGSAAHVTVRFGADGKLYAGVAGASDGRAAQDLSSPLGKILRLNPDGTSPRDNPRSSPTFTSGHRDPRALAWQPGSGAMWEIDRDHDRGDEVNTIIAGGDYGWPGSMSGGRSIAPVLTLPASTDVAGASFVPASSRSPLAGELLVASKGAEDLLRVQIDATGQVRVIEGIVRRQYGRLSAVAVGPDGTIYATTSNSPTWGSGNDALIRLAPAAQ
jgi:aldose sugar dehydrogenase